MDSIFVVDEFVNVRPGEPYRLLPFGTLFKGGKKREITPEFAHKFKLPHFKPPIKLGSHKEETPGGGKLLSLFVGDDGLYVTPELTDKGAKSLEDGDYGYHSPEIIWEGGFEDPETGKISEGPLIVGDAWLHTPHLGEAAALYEYQFIENKGAKVMSDYVEVPKSFFEKLLGKAVPEPVEAELGEFKAEPIEESEEYKAMVQERDEFAVKLESLEAEKKLQEQMSAILEEFETDEFGVAYVELGKADESVEILASMDEKQREWVITQLKALSKQIDESSLLKEKGADGEGIDSDDPKSQLDAIVRAKSIEDKISYNEALQIVRAEQPDLVAGAYSKEVK